MWRPAGIAAVGAPTASPVRYRCRRALAKGAGGRSPSGSAVVGRRDFDGRTIFLDSALHAVYVLFVFHSGAAGDVCPALAGR